MAELWVVNASPLIGLGSVGRLDLLAALATEVVVPEVVAAEVARGQDDASSALAQQSSFRVEPVEPSDLVARWGLGPGETAVLSFAQRNRGYVVIIDDLAARRCASALGVPVRGTAGVVLLAKARGLLPSVAPVLREWRAAGLYLSPALISFALSLVGEREDE